MGPYHKTCNCRCLPPFPCIEGCAKSGDFTYDTVALTMTAPTYSYTTASDSFRYNVGDAVANIYNSDISAVGPSKTLKRRPNSAAFGYGQKNGSSDCQWLWNDPIAVPSMVLYPNFLNCDAPFYPLPYTPSVVTDGTPYVPVNAIDSTSPWDRVLIANPDYLCSTCYCTGCGSFSSNPRGHYQCGNVVYYSSAVLYIIEGGVPGVVAPYYTPLGSGYWYWILDFKAFGGHSWSYNSDSQVTRTAVTSALGGNQPNFGGHVTGGVAMDGLNPQIVTLQYAKEIDCDTDFEGTAITLPFSKYIDQSGPYTYLVDTYPSSVTIALTP